MSEQAVFFLLVVLLGLVRMSTLGPCYIYNISRFSFLKVALFFLQPSSSYQSVCPIDHYCAFNHQEVWSIFLEFPLKQYFNVLMQSWRWKFNLCKGQFTDVCGRGKNLMREVSQLINLRCDFAWRATSPWNWPCLVLFSFEDHLAFPPNFVLPFSTLRNCDWVLVLQKLLPASLQHAKPKFFSYLLSLSLSITSLKSFLHSLSNWFFFLSILKLCVKTQNILCSFILYGFAHKLDME